MKNQVSLMLSSLALLLLVGSGCEAPSHDDMDDMHMDDDHEHAEEMMEDAMEADMAEEAMEKGEEMADAVEAAAEEVVEEAAQ